MCLFILEGFGCLYGDFFFCLRLCFDLNKVKRSFVLWRGYMFLLFLRIFEKLEIIEFICLVISLRC